MQPLTLSMQAFGPFDKRVTIDFTRLGKRGIFLIKGATGSGKTMIFDAMSFALFGKGSFAGRAVKQHLSTALRCNFSKPSRHTMVEFSFEHQGGHYQVMRWFKDSKMSVELVVDGKQRLHDREANIELSQILGIDHHQFKMICMLVQGSFREFLFSKSKDKEELFAKIFPQELAQRLEEEIKRDAKDVQDCCEELYSRYEHYVQQAIAQLKEVKSDDEPLLSGDPHRMKEVLDWVKQGHQVLLEQQARYKKDIDELTVQEQRAHEQKRLLAQRRDGLQELLTVQGQIAEYVKLQAQHQQAHLQADEEYRREHDDIVRQQMAYQQKLEEHKRFSDLHTQEASVRSDLEKAQQRHVYYLEKAEKLASNIEQMMRELHGAVDDESQHVSLVEEQQQLKEQHRRLELADRAYRRLALHVTQRDALESQYHHARQQREKTKEYWDNALMKQHESIRSMLAHDLVEGEPCPVCGSLHHPQAYSATDAELMSSEELKQMQDKHDHASTICQQALAALQAHDVKQQEMYQECQQLLQDCRLEQMQGNSEDSYDQQTRRVLRDALASCVQRLDEIGREIEQKRQRREELLQLRQTVDERRQEQHTLQEQIVTAHLSVVEYETQHHQVMRELDTLRNTLGETTQERIKTEVDELKMRDQELEQSKVQAAQRLDKAVQKLHELHGRSDHLKVVLDCGEDAVISQKMVDEVQAEYARVSAHQSQLDVHQKDLREQLDVLMRKGGALDLVLDDLRQTTEAYTVQQSKACMLKDLRDAVLGGASHVSFTSYLLIRYFDRIVKRANIHLDVMTAGRLQLIRAQEMVGRGSQGLELMVKDRHSAGDALRPVTTLSGGETFEASLALALGLSEMVQEQVAGITFETLFIDEGFGTLDSSTLMRVMKVLQALGKGNLLVGVISHVDTLAEWIPNKIVVERNEHEGSSISLDCAWACCDDADLCHEEC